jgi:hypothetical protein
MVMGEWGGVGFMVRVGRELLGKGTEGYWRLVTSGISHFSDRRYVRLMEWDGAYRSPGNDQSDHPPQ